MKLRVYSLHFFMQVVNAQPPIDWLPEEIESLSQLQMKICEARDLSISTNYGQLDQQFGLSSQSSISICIRRTISGFDWDSETQAEPWSYLSDAQFIKFFDLVNQMVAISIA